MVLSFDRIGFVNFENCLRTNSYFNTVGRTINKIRHIKSLVVTKWNRRSRRLQVLEGGTKRDVLAALSAIRPGVMDWSVDKERIRAPRPWHRRWKSSPLAATIIPNSFVKEKCEVQNSRIPRQNFPLSWRQYYVTALHCLQSIKCGNPQSRFWRNKRANVFKQSCDSC